MKRAKFHLRYRDCSIYTVTDQTGTEEVHVLDSGTMRQGPSLDWPLSDPEDADAVMALRQSEARDFVQWCANHPDCAETAMSMGLLP